MPGHKQDTSGTHTATGPPHTRGTTTDLCCDVWIGPAVLNVLMPVFCQVGVGRFGVSFSPCERRVSGRFGVGRSITPEILRKLVEGLR